MRLFILKPRDSGVTITFVPGRSLKKPPKEVRDIPLEDLTKVVKETLDDLQGRPD